ncbi:MAG: type II toxin-antitoxin system VapB family antitoxin [Rhodospirillaceae bacterium]
MVTSVRPPHWYMMSGHTPGNTMRTSIEIDDEPMAEAQRLSGLRSKKQTVEEALRLMVRFAKQREVDAAFGRCRWSLRQKRRAAGVARPQR